MPSRPQIGPEKEEFTVDGLTPKKKYKFRVKAVNKEGESEPLENDEPITARNPYGQCQPEYLNMYRLINE